MSSQTGCLGLNDGFGSMFVRLENDCFVGAVLGFSPEMVIVVASKIRDTNVGANTTESGKRLQTEYIGGHKRIHVPSHGASDLGIHWLWSADRKSISRGPLRSPVNRQASICAFQFNSENPQNERLACPSDDGRRQELVTMP
jgi:hypothetical protein